jgi:hypothetical protein
MEEIRSAREGSYVYSEKEEVRGAVAVSIEAYGRKGAA